LLSPRVLLPAGVVLLVLTVAAFPDAFAGWFGHGDPRACDLANSRGGPRSGHPFGFDIQGCDLYANVVYGARPSVFIGLTVTLGAVLVAIVLGCSAAYFGRWVDATISRTMDVFFGFPVLVGQVVVLNSIASRNAAVVAGVLVLFVWPFTTRLMRSAALATVEQGYVKAARGLGAGPWRIISRHVLPNSAGPVVAVVGISVGAMITLESALTFLGVGLRQPTISWGVQLNTAQSAFRSDPHLLLFPSLFLTVTVLAFVLLGDALRDVFDPRLR
jgi:ABC-type dipeptide/oligopeptide/nickel transport system permease subunit